MKDYSDIELRILKHIRAVGDRNHEAERKYVELKETVATIVLVAAVGIWSTL